MAAAPTTTQPSQMFDPNYMPDSMNYNGMPTRPSYITAYDPTTMSLTDYLQGKYDHSGYDQFKSEAMRKGPSAWATLAQQDQSAQAQKNLNAGAAETNAQTAQSEDNLAARGGLSSGARERAGQEGAKNYLSMAQGIAQGQTANDMQIGMNDEQNRIQQLSQIPGMEQAQGQMWEGAKQQDIANTTTENERRNQYNQTVYGQQMQAWGANQQANATANSGKK